MKKLILFFVIAFSVICAKAQTAFQKSYGGIKWEYVHHMRQTSDSGYVITGAKPRNNVSVDLDVFLLRTDVNGNLLWNKAYGGAADDIGHCVESTADGGYVIAGVTESYGMGLEDAYFIKTDSAGNIQWSKVMGTIHYDNIFSVKQTIDGGYIFAGLFDGYNGGVTDIYLIKTDSNGDTLWTRTLGGTSSQSGYSLKLTNDGGFIITGSAGSPAGSRVYALKTDSTGIPVWTKTYGGSSHDEGRDVQVTSDGGYIITGVTNFGAGNQDVYLIKTDSIGAILWTKTYGSPDYECGFSVQQTQNGGYIITGYSTDIIGTYDIYTILTDSGGDTLWTRTILGAQSASGGCVALETSDGGYIIAADSYFVPGNAHDILLIKTDSLGFSGCNTGHTPTTIGIPATQTWSPAVPVSSGGIITLPSEITTNTPMVVTTLCTNTLLPETSNLEQPFNVYPNPSNGIFILDFDNLYDKNLTIQVLNTSGAVIFCNNHTGYLETNRIQIEIPALACGIYLLKIVTDKKILYKKLIIDL